MMIEIIIFIIIALIVIGLLQSLHVDNYSKVKVTDTEDNNSITTDALERKTLNIGNKDNTNSKLQTRGDDEKLVQPTNRTTHLYQHNYLDQRVVKHNTNSKLQTRDDDEKIVQPTNRANHLYQHNYLDLRVVNNLYLNSSKADVIKRNVSVPRKPRTTKYVLYDTDRLRCFVSRKETLLKKAEEINTATGCDIYLEVRYEEKPHIYKSETFQNYSLKQEAMDISPSDDNRRSQNKRGKRRPESDDDLDTEDNKLSPVKIPKTIEHKNSGNRKQTENEMETEGDECVCNICGEYEDDDDKDDDKGPWVNCDYQYEDLSCCMYTAHVTCLELEEYPQHFLCSEHME